MSSVEMMPIGDPPCGVLVVPDQKDRSIWIIFGIITALGMLLLGGGIVHFLPGTSQAIDRIVQNLTGLTFDSTTLNHFAVVMLISGGTLASLGSLKLILSKILPAKNVYSKQTTHLTVSVLLGTLTAFIVIFVVHLTKNTPSLSFDSPEPNQMSIQKTNPVHIAKVVAEKKSNDPIHTLKMFIEDIVKSVRHYLEHFNNEVI